jgi:small-conductance mechanosensitive channel
VAPWVTQLQQIIATDPFIGVRIGAIFVVAVGALLLGRWLQRTASRFPLYVGVREVADPDRPHKWRPAQTGTAVSRWVGRLAFLCVLAAAAVLIAAIIGVGNPVNVSAALRSAIPYVIGLAPRLTSSLILTAITLAVARLAQRGVVGGLAAARVDRSLQRLGGRSAYILTLLIGAVIVLGIWGVPLAVPGIFLGVLTLALSLALQDVLRNLFAGVYLLVERPFLIGDEITVTDFTGRIEDIQLRVTSLRAPDGERVLLPNALLFTSAVVNASANQLRRAVVAVSIPAEAPDARERASDAITAALATVSAIQLQPAPYVVLSGATQGNLELRAVFWVPANPSDAALATISGAVDGIRTALPTADVSVVEPPLR